MARRSSRNGFSVLAGLPWPASILVGVIGLLAIRYLPAWWFSRGGQLTHGMGIQLDETLSPLAWVFLAFCWIAALASYLGARRRRRLLETSSSLESLPTLKARVESIRCLRQKVMLPFQCIPARDVGVCLCREPMGRPGSGFTGAVRIRGVVVLR